MKEVFLDLLVGVMDSEWWFEAQQKRFVDRVPFVGEMISLYSDDSGWAEIKEIMWRHDGRVCLRMERHTEDTVLQKIEQDDDYRVSYGDLISACKHSLECGGWQVTIPYGVELRPYAGSQ